MTHFSFIFLILSLLPLNTQPCERVDIQDKKQLKVLKRFIYESRSKGFLTADSGYIHLTEWVDEQGETNWQLSALRKWRLYPWIAPFQGHCTDCLVPMGWTKVANRMILRYNYNRDIDTLTKAESSCLQKLLAPSVTILPPLAPPPKEVPRKDADGRLIVDKAGKPIMQPFYRNVSAGSGGENDTHITFKKDGSVEKALSL